MPAGPAAPRRLHGRVQALATLDGVLRDPGSPGAVVAGPAGIGKSTLVADALHRRASEGAAVHVGHACAVDAMLPFAPLVEALDLAMGSDDRRRAAAAELLRDPAPGTLDTSHAHWRVIDAVVDLVDADARSGPVVLVIEDVHWADPYTVVALRRLWAAARHLELSVVVTTRPDPSSDELAATLREAAAVGCAVITLDTLDDAAIIELAQEHLGAPPGPALRRLLTRAGGNPLYTVELLEVLVRTGGLSADPSTGTVDTTADEGAVDAILARRLEIAPPDVRRVLASAAVLGPRFRLDELAALRHETSSETWAALGPAVAAGLVGEDADRLAFRHEMIHGALYRELPEAVRAALHADVARSLDELGAPPERVGAHLALASPSPATALRLLDLADEVIDRAPEVAGAWASHVSEQLAPGHAGRVRAQLVRARAAALGERPHDAVALATALLDEGLSAGDAAQLWATIAQAEHYVGEPSRETAEALRQVLDGLPEDDPRWPRATVLGARALRAVGEIADATRLASRVLDAEVADAGARCVALGMLSRQALFDGNAAAAFELSDRALGLARSSGTLLEWTGVEVVKDFGWVRGPDVADEQLVEVCQEVIAEAERRGLRTALPAIQAELAETLRFRGRWREAETHAWAAVDGLDSSRYASVEADAWFVLLNMASRRGDARLFDRLPEPLRASDSNVSLSSLTLDHAWALEHVGEHDTAWARASAARTWFEREAPVFMFIWSHPYVRLALRRGDREAASTFTDLVEHAASRMGGHPILLAQARMDRALLERDVDLARDAVALAGLGPVFPNRVDAWIVAGEVLGDAGERDEAVGMLEAARPWAVDADATVDVGRIDHALRQLGVIATRPRRRPPTGWQALTEAEQRVAAAIVEGLTYREIGQRLYVSRRTVESHAASIFRKVGVRTRNELTAAWHARGA